MIAVRVSPLGPQPPFSLLIHTRCFSLPWMPSFLRKLSLEHPSKSFLPVQYIAVNVFQPSVSVKAPCLQCLAPICSQRGEFQPPRTLSAVKCSCTVRLYNAGRQARSWSLSLGQSHGVPCSSSTLSNLLSCHWYLWTMNCQSLRSNYSSDRVPMTLAILEPKQVFILHSCLHLPTNLKIPFFPFAHCRPGRPIRKSLVDSRLGL